MKKEVSVYLDLWRILAALAVVAEHASDYVGGWIWHFGSWGAEAVAVFFVLSGAVIAYVVDRRESTAATYFSARALRLYSVVVPSILVVWILDAIGGHYAPHAYSTSLNVQPSVLGYLRSLTFTHQLWNSGTHYGTNAPYWSLGFEAVYYALFGAAVFIRGRPVFRVAALTAILALAGPRLAMFFPLWLMGVGTYWLTKVHNPDTRPSREWSAGRAQAFWAAACISSLVMLAVLHDWAHSVHDYLKIYQKFQVTSKYFESVSYFYLVGLLFAASVVAISRMPKMEKGVIEYVGTPIRWLAGATFTLYLMNLPLLLFFNAVIPSLGNETVRKSAVLFSAVAAAFFMAELFERTRYLSRAINFTFHADRQSLR